MQEEIDQVIGRNQPPKYEDHLEMPYTEAVIHESQRFVAVIPFGLPRSTTKDIKFLDFLIPKVLPCSAWRKLQSIPPVPQPLLK